MNIIDPTIYSKSDFYRGSDNLKTRWCQDIIHKRDD